MQLDANMSAVVTGGASGLGLASAKALRARGVNVVIVYLNAAAGEARGSKATRIVAGRGA